MVHPDTHRTETSAAAFWGRAAGAVLTAAAASVSATNEVESEHSAMEASHLTHEVLKTPGVCKKIRYIPVSVTSV